MQSPYRSVACLLEGVALRLAGEPDAAIRRLREGADLGELFVPATQTQCLAELATIAGDAGDWSQATKLIDSALRIAEEFHLQDRGNQVEVFAIGAFVHAHTGRHEDADRELKGGLWLLSMDPAMAPWMAAESRGLLARAGLLLGESDTARMLAKEAVGYAALVPDATSLHERLDHLLQMTEHDGGPLGITATPLTPAEMRVLRYLPTHLTFAAIADELFVSRNTVKTQAIAIYRKLGVSSRTPAVDTARELGLLER